MSVDKREATRLSKVLVAALLMPPIAWLLQLAVLYALVTSACLEGTKAALHLTTLGALAVALCSGLVAWKAASVTGLGPTDEGSVERGRIRFLAMGGVVFAVLFAMVAAATHLPVFLLRSCG